MIFGTGIHRCAGEAIAVAIAVRAGRSLLERNRFSLERADERSFSVLLSFWS